jgi:hypothetical protein
MCRLSISWLISSYDGRSDARLFEDARQVAVLEGQFAA